MNILYISRKFPPSVGGMQTQSREFYENISATDNIKPVLWGHSQVFLPFFLIFAFIKSVVELSTSRIDIIQLGDLVLSPLGLVLKLLFNKPALAVSHGRDSVYRSRLYDLFVIGAAKRLDKIICVSDSNKKRLSARGISEEKLTVIPNGISVKPPDNMASGRERYLHLIGDTLGIDLSNKKIVLSACRLVPKKGIREFIEDIFFKISRSDDNVLFLIAGNGPEREAIVKVINAFGLKEKVYLLGFLRHGSPLYKALFAVSDVFVMPNIRVNDDAEGFGLVILEAGINALPVVAYNVDGVSEALHHSKNGLLIQEARPDLFAAAVISFLEDPGFRKHFADSAKEYVINNFNWPRVIGRYREEYARLIKEAG